MRIIFALVLCIAASAAAQTTPGNPINPNQPGNPANPNQPGIPTQSSAPGTANSPETADPTSPASVSPAPPAFVPGATLGTSQKPHGPVRISGGVMANNVVNKVEPVYPPDAKRAGVRGSVVFEAMIGKAGNIENLRVISGVPVLATAAADAVRHWTYRPYKLNGEPIEVQTTITINFR